MIEPWLPEGEISAIGWPYIWTVEDTAPSSPKAVSGVISPARFRVEGLQAELEFTTIPTSNPPGVAIGSVSVKFGDDSPRADWPIDLARLLRSAMTASAARGTHYPAGIVLSAGSDDLEILSDSDSLVLANHIGPLSRSEARKIEGTLRVSRERPRQIDEEVLREVAEIFQSTPKAKYWNVAQALQVSESSARDLIRKARQEGFLPDVPDTDKRKARRK